VACDMQQDRSTGWRLGTNRVLQFRYQVLGIVVGAMLATGLGSGWAMAFGFVAVTLASVNIFGGFVVTQRMLSMFRRRQ